MPKVNIINDENAMPKNFIPAKRIDFMDHTHDTLHTIIQDHCIEKGHPLVVSNLNKTPGWKKNFFTLNQLKKSRGDTEILYHSNHHKKTVKARLGSYIETLQKKLHLNSKDQYDQPSQPNQPDQQDQHVQHVQKVQTVQKVQHVQKNEPLPNLQNSEPWPNLQKREPLSNLLQNQATAQVGSDIEMHSNTYEPDYTIQKSSYFTTSQDDTTYQDGTTSQDDATSQDDITSQDDATSQDDTKEYKTLDYGIEGVYAKDITCPDEYRSAINNVLPEYLLPHGSNDLFSLLPERFKAENLMVYLGQDDTGTPTHRDLCGTMGHNIMTMASPGGYSEWYVVLNENRTNLASVIKPTNDENKDTNRLDRESSNKNSVAKSSFMESDRAWLTPDLVKERCNFNVQVVLQRPGDLVIIPSRAYHQVRNVGVSIKVAWNRITPQTLEYAFEDQLPLYHIINRPEVYKCKAIVTFSIESWNNIISAVSASQTHEIENLSVMKYGREAFLKNSGTLLNIYLMKVLGPEMLTVQDETDITVDEKEEAFTVKCDFCHCDIFHRYYHCEDCEEYDLCMECYSVGRSCKHVSNMKMRQGPVPLLDRIQLYKTFISNINRIFNEQVLNDNSQCLDKYTGKDTPSLATICRRIETYRRAKGDELNTIDCTHCSDSITVAELAESGVSLASIFRRNPCVGALSETSEDDTDVYVCKECVTYCESCQTLVESNDNLPDFDLVYYADPALDERNWGAFFDYNVNQSCSYPEEMWKPAVTPLTSKHTAPSDCGKRSGRSNSSNDEHSAEPGKKRAPRKRNNEQISGDTNTDMTPSPKRSVRAKKPPATPTPAASSSHSKRSGRSNSSNGEHSAEPGKKPAPRKRNNEQMSGDTNTDMTPSPKRSVRAKKSPATPTPAACSSHSKRSGRNNDDDYSEPGTNSNKKAVSRKRNNTQISEDTNTDINPSTMRSVRAKKQ